MTRVLDRPLDGALRQLVGAAEARGLASADLAALSRLGLPHAGLEAWRFTPLGALADASLSLPAQGGRALTAQEWAALDVSVAETSLILVDGELQGAPRLPTGVSLRVGPSGSAPLPSHFDSESDGFALMNRALQARTVLLEVAAGVELEQPLELVVIGAARAEHSLALPRVEVRLGERAKATLRVAVCALPGSSVGLSSEVLAVELGAGAGLTLGRLSLGTRSVATVAEWTVRQAASSRLSLLVASCGGRLSRLSARVLLEGEGAEADVDSLYLSSLEELVDHHFLVDHRAPGCRSAMSCRGIVDAGGRAVFDGRTFVRSTAPRTDARQETRNLLLSDDAVLNAKPHLEIDNDDVVCSHGATVGRLDESALFYMRARGIDAETAKALLTHAFVGEVIERLATAVPRSWVEAVRSRLPAAASLAEADTELGGAA